MRICFSDLSREGKEKLLFNKAVSVYDSKEIQFFAVIV